ncbi:ribonuclease H-like domain-containing protein [Scheffersomyces coipomensis]|uniref:ribonuclease H-like domain-containing protein n=1 Tax=Scheffersomyces coipomensis TaxID=1788519 RepID=UPI00315DCF85
MVYYAVAKGKNAGVYSDWQSCKDQVSGYSGASYKKFNTAAEASQFINSGGHSNSNSSYTPSSSSSYSGSYSNSSSNSYTKSSTSSSSTRSSGGSSSYNDYSSSYSGSYGGSSYSKPSQPKQQIYVDGASRGNGRETMPDSGYGVWYGDNHPKNAAVPLTKVDNVKINKPTNQRAELFGMAHALKDIHQDLKTGSKKDYEILTDSAYAKNSIETWSNNWEKNGWKNSQGKPIANKDIIETARKEYRAIKSYENKESGSIAITHVRGHQGNVGNENADRLANQGADEMSSRK